MGKMVLFDAGNTLVLPDLSLLYSAARGRVTMKDLDNAERSMRIEMNDYFGSEKVSTENRDTFRMYHGRLLEKAGLADDLIEGALLVLERMDRRFNIWRRLNIEAIGTLEALKDRGAKLGVVSNADGRVEELLDSVGLSRWFDIIVDSSIEGIEKPDPGIFHRAVERLGGEEDETWYVGDIPVIDLKGAEAAGIEPILYDPFDLFGGVEAKRVRDLGEIPDLIFGRAI